MHQRTKRITVAVTVVLVALIYGLLLWQGPWWIDGAHLRKTDLEPADGVVVTGVRTMLVALGVGIVTAFGVYYTRQTLEHNRDTDRKQAELTRDGQVTDRYVEAVKLLSAESVIQRLGGIYALERIMRDSERDQRTVVEVLAAFVREPPPDAAEKDGEGRPRQDVQAALTVLGRMPMRERGLRIDLGRARMHDVSLFKARLKQANLGSSHLEGANLDGARLRRANLSAARLDEADMVQASLRDANLTQASLKAADLNGADLTGAILTLANLKGARLAGASLEAARLDGADLAGADLEDASCTVESLLTACITSDTRLPESVAHDPKIQRRIRECESRAETLEPKAHTGDCGWKPGGRSFPRGVVIRSIDDLTA